MKDAFESGRKDAAEAVEQNLALWGRVAFKSLLDAAKETPGDYGRGLVAGLKACQKALKAEFALEGGGVNE